MVIGWQDERYQTGNEHRNTECKSNDVVHEKNYNRLWLPEFIVPAVDDITWRDPFVI